MSKFSDIAATQLGEVAAGALAEVLTDTSLIDVVTQMRDRRLGAVLVVEASAVVGIFTERDVVKRLDHKDLSWHSTPVGEVMSPKPTTIGTTETISDALNTMIAGSFRHLPLLGPDGKPVGILSIRDLLTYMVEFYPQEFVNLPPDPGHEATGQWGG